MFFVELPNIHILRKLDLLDLPLWARKCHWRCPNEQAPLVSLNQKAA